MFLLLRVFKCSETWTPACPAWSFTHMRTSSGSDWDCNRRCINKGLLNLFNVARLFALKFRDLFSLCNFTLLFIVIYISTLTKVLKCKSLTVLIWTSLWKSFFTLNRQYVSQLLTSLMGNIRLRFYTKQRFTPLNCKLYQTLFSLIDKNHIWSISTLHETENDRGNC